MTTTENKHASGLKWEVFTGGYKIEAGERNEQPIAVFQYEQHARRWAKSLWPSTFEVRKINDD